MPNTIEFLIMAAYAVAFTTILTYCALPLFGILQQEGYRSGDALKWYVKKKNMLRRRYQLLALCVVLVTALLGLCFSFLGPFADVIGAAGYVGLCALFVFAFGKALKVPVDCTRRLIRLLICTYVLIFAAVFGAEIGLFCAAKAIGKPWAEALKLAPVGLIPALLFLFVAAANCIMKAYEVPRARHFIKTAKRALDGSGCVKVGITGSFGKTSVKTFAAQMLATKFSVKATPASYNTPIGIAKFVNGEGTECDIFLAEMGARHVGDIKELCEMVKPTVGVITGVCEQHLETFKSLENIRREKGELARAAEKVVLGKTAADLREDALIEDRDFFAKNIHICCDKTTFTLVLGEKEADVETKILGRHAAEDIAISAALSLSLGMSFEEIVSAIPTLAPVPHRLERSENGGVVILDDSYNSNPAGAKNAVEVLKTAAGRKVVVTPGLVELGEIEEAANEVLGETLVGLDSVILVGETRVLAVRNGYKNAGGDEGKLQIVPTLSDAQEKLKDMLQFGDTVLFLNDLPDKY